MALLQGLGSLIYLLTCAARHISDGGGISYSWTSRQLRKEVAPVIWLLAADFHSKSSFEKLMKNWNNILKKTCHMVSTKLLIFMSSVFTCKILIVDPKIVQQTTGVFWYFIVLRVLIKK